MKKGTIAGFQGKYRWLSNFERCDVLYKGIIYPSSESAYQAQKLSPTRSGIKARKVFAKLDARDAKTMGNVIQLREDWDDIKLEEMEGIVRAKMMSPQFKSRLLDTGEMEIIESNHWGDTFWGTYNGEGENHLGKIIMKIRDEARESVRAK